MGNFLGTLSVGACLVALSLGGACSDDDSTGSAATPARETTSESASDPSLTAKAKTFSIDGSDVSFKLPLAWEAFDLDRMQEALADSGDMDELSDRMGMSREQLQQLITSNIVLYATAPHAVDGFLDNVNVLVAEGQLPSTGTFELQYRGLGATDIHSDAVTTSAGDGYTTTYSLNLNGTEVRGQAIAIAVEDQAIVITVSSSDAKKADRLASQVLDSLAESSP